MHALPALSLLGCFVGASLAGNEVIGRDYDAVVPTAKEDSSCSYWLEEVDHQGLATFNNDPDSYQVFRNVRDFGAKGDGAHDDTKAINAAIRSGGRCAPNGLCASTTTTPATIYFPQGTYLISAPLVDYYYTSTIGNPNCRPVIKASENFTGSWMWDGNRFGDKGLGWGPTNVFYRQLSNLVFDLTQANSTLTAIHWTVSQATSLRNVAVKMSTKPDTEQQGIFLQGGSGGFVGDLEFEGGKRGLSVGNQQFTMRNLTFNHVSTAINQLYSWGWTYHGVSINNCQVGVNMSDPAVSSIVFIDGEIKNTPVGFLSGRNSTAAASKVNSLIMENVAVSNVSVLVQAPAGTPSFPGPGTGKIAAWGQGHSYVPRAGADKPIIDAVSVLTGLLPNANNKTGPVVFRGPFQANKRPDSLTTSDGLYYQRAKPDYGRVSKDKIVSIRTAGAKGDGTTDDSDVINRVLAGAAKNGSIVFFDAGYYNVSKTIFVPAGSRIKGESFPVILSSGTFFANMSTPKPVVQVGREGDKGTVEWSDTIVSGKGAQAGAILIQWNLESAKDAPSGMWEVHTRIGGFRGSDLQIHQCRTAPDKYTTPSNVEEKCIGAFMSMHVTKPASNLYVEDCWLWTADHDIDDDAVDQLTIYAGRGLLIESAAGGIWLYGTGVEHHTLYNYHLADTRDVVMGYIQEETAYYQPNPGAFLPFPALPEYHDPVFATGEHGTGVRVVNSTNVLVHGAGLYSFFNNNNNSCAAQDLEYKCQSRIFEIENSSAVSVYGLVTVGTQWLLTLDQANYAHWKDNQNGFPTTVALFRA